MLRSRHFICHQDQANQLIDQKICPAPFRHTGVNGAQSGGLRRPGSEDPHRCQRKFPLLLILKILFNGKSISGGSTSQPARIYIIYIPKRNGISLAANSYHFGPPYWFVGWVVCWVGWVGGGMLYMQRPGNGQVSLRSIRVL